MLNRSFGTQHGVKRLLLDVIDVENSVVGLKELVEVNSWRAAATQAKKLLNDYIDSLPIQDVLEIYFTRVLALFKLRAFERASQELKLLGNLDRPELFYEFYPETFKGRRGSFVPFSLRVLASTLPHYLGLTAEALERLAQLQVYVRTVIALVDKDPTLVSPDLKES